MLNLPAPAAPHCPLPIAVPWLPVDRELPAFNGWLASSLELRRGLSVQVLDVDPREEPWRAFFGG